MPRTAIPIRRLEERCLNAWPSLHRLWVDGWEVRFGAGFTRRANSVQALWPGEGPVQARIAACEALYAERGQPSVFKITPLAQPSALDDLLGARGYRREGETSVQVLEALPEPAVDDACATLPATAAAWQDAFTALDGTPAQHRATLAALLAQIPLPHTGALLHDGGAVAGCGRAVLEAHKVGLFDIATAAHVRGRGYGERMVRHLLAWGRTHGAQRAYLQVEVDNAPAQRLYARLGFREVYRYWYRVR